MSEFFVDLPSSGEAISMVEGEVVDHNLVSMNPLPRSPKWGAHITFVNFVRLELFVVFVLKLVFFALTLLPPLSSSVTSTER